MIERLLDNMTKQELRLPDVHKENIYCLLRWMITEFDKLILKDNIDINNKRIRKNEAIVRATLSKKMSENINKLLPKMSSSRENNMDTLLELFNFSSSIIISGMRNLNDLIKPDDLVNDLSILQDMSYTAKGPESLGETSSNNVASRMRDIHISFVGKIDLNCTSNSDVGMSGSFTPFVKLYDNFYFTPEREPDDTLFNIVSDIVNTCKDPKEFSFGVLTGDNVNIDSKTGEIITSDIIPIDVTNKEEFNRTLRDSDIKLEIHKEPILLVEKVI